MIYVLSLDLLLFKEIENENNLIFPKNLTNLNLTTIQRLVENISFLVFGFFLGGGGEGSKGNIENKEFSQMEN